ncbi:DUF1963 domain-containing protein [Streptomyces sp. 351MFTsu5.1]|uniref:DUF1963 domain-containing protein n=1 Tax=Streptomyces sp. 351MFTsu5.1 TaxID=1172180 RepID=UPI0003823588|nr:DUF1963 domain-containing protein [Streptomyces sp. 351MFTsu5.1]
MTDEQYSPLAAEHLPGERAQRWTALLRPCARLRRALGEPVPPGTWAGARVLYIPENTPVVPADQPPALEPLPPVELGADDGQSAPDLSLPQARRALLGDTRPWPHPRDTPAELKPFVRTFRRLRTRIGHQIGGHAVPVQGPVEYEIANATHGGTQAWGDEAVLYWLIRPEDLAAHRFDQARLTVQG